MRDSVPSGSYSSVCNVLRQWKSRSSLLIESTDSMILMVKLIVMIKITILIIINKFNSPLVSQFNSSLISLWI